MTASIKQLRRAAVRSRRRTEKAGAAYDRVWWNVDVPEVEVTALGRAYDALREETAKRHVRLMDAIDTRLMKRRAKKKERLRIAYGGAITSRFSAAHPNLSNTPKEMAP